MKKEHFDSPQGLSDKLDQLAAWIKESRHFIVFTGTWQSSSIEVYWFVYQEREYQHPRVFLTFAVAWIQFYPPDPVHGNYASIFHRSRDRHISPMLLLSNKASRSKKAVVLNDMHKAIPSPTHMYDSLPWLNCIEYRCFCSNRALVELQRRGILKCLVSQNCDGLHLRSGMNPKCLSELHGNMNLEKCSACDAKYLRDFDTAIGRYDHYTGRNCDKPQCGGRLKDSIINFGENLPEEEIEKAFRHAENADLCLVLGKVQCEAHLVDSPFLFQVPV